MSLFSLDNDHTQELLQKQTDSVQYQQKLYESPDLAQGTHVLVVTILSVPSVKAYFTFDWAECHTKPTLSYHPTCDISTASPTEQFGDLHPVMLNTSHQGVQMVIRLDDRDCTISYSADTWSLEENNSEYLATTTRTTRPGAFMRIPFIGTYDISSTYYFTYLGLFKGLKLRSLGQSMLWTVESPRRLCLVLMVAMARCLLKIRLRQCSTSKDFTNLPTSNRDLTFLWSR